MPTTIPLAQALEISHAANYGAYLKTNATDQLLPRLPKVPVRGDALQVAAIASLATAGFIASAGDVDNSATTFESTARSFSLRRIAARVDVPGDVAPIVSQVVDVTDQQIQAKLVGIWNAVGDKLVNGTGVMPEPAGLVTLSAEHPDGVKSLGAALTLSVLDDVLYRLRPWDGDTPIAFVGNRGMLATITQLMIAAGMGLDVRADAMLGKPLLHYRGVPILVSDWITDTEGAGSNKTSVYGVILGAREGEPQLGGLVWGFAADTGAGIVVGAPQRNSNLPDVLLATLEVNLCFASLSTGAVYRVKDVTPYTPS